MDVTEIAAKLRQCADWYERVYPKLFKRDLPQEAMQLDGLDYVEAPLKSYKRLPNNGTDIQDDLRRFASQIEELKAHADAMAAALEPFAVQHDTKIAIGGSPTADMEDAACALDAYRKWLEEGK